MGVEFQTGLIAAIAAILVGTLTAAPGLLAALIQLKKDTNVSLYQLLELKEKELIQARECCDKYRLETIRLTEQVIALQLKQTYGG